MPPKKKKVESNEIKEMKRLSIQFQADNNLTKK
jgi:hypothetical protein